MIQHLPPDQLVELADNPRTIEDDDFERLCESITRNPDFFELRPIVCSDRTGELVVIAGNQRLKAAKHLGLATVPVGVLSGLTVEREREIAVRDNVTNGEWDAAKLEGWAECDLVGWGVDIGFDVDLPEYEREGDNSVAGKAEPLQASEDAYEAPPKEEIKTDIVLGDLITFEKDGVELHRLLCGDSTDAETVARLMAGEKATLAHNDPPYGMKKEKDGVLNDNLNFNDLLEFNKLWINLQFEHLEDNGSFYCWGTDEPLMDIYSEILKPLIKTQRATFRNLITWSKGHGQGQNSELIRQFAVADEKCLFIMCGVQGFNNNADNYFEGWGTIVNYLDSEKQKANLSIKDCKRIAGHSENSGCHWFDKSQWNMPTKEVYNSWKAHCKQNNVDAFAKEYDELKKEYDELKKEYYSTRAYFDGAHGNFNNVWHIDRAIERNQHATPKPIELCERVIKSSSPENALVIDFFLGSGSTMVAAHQLNRRCYGLELEPNYNQIIAERMHKLDPSLTIKRNGEPMKFNQLPF